jgi:hypothetical protein
MMREPIDRLHASQALLKLLHEHRGLRLNWIAARIDVSPTLISMWRNGSRVPTEADLERLRKLVRRTKP